MNKILPVHMNGRIYDARLGRFLQADPIVQAPKNSQNLNRYSYVLNNPLSYTDPSGFFIKRLIGKWGRVILAAIVSYYTFGWGSNLAWTAMPSVAAGVATTSAYTASVVVGGAAAGFVGSAIANGSMKGSLRAAFAGALTAGVAGRYGPQWSGARIVTQSLASGIAAKISGGQFEDGLKLGLAVNSMGYFARVMRARMIAQSKLDPRNISGASKGFEGDNIKIGGGRFDPELEALGLPQIPSPLGGAQGSAGQIFGHSYPPGSYYPA